MLIILDKDEQLKAVTVGGDGVAVYTPEGELMPNYAVDIGNGSIRDTEHGVDCPIIGEADTKDEAFDLINNAGTGLEYNSIANFVDWNFDAGEGSQETFYILAAKDINSGKFYTSNDGWEGIFLNLPVLEGEGLGEEDAINECRNALNPCYGDPKLIGEHREGGKRYIVEYVEVDGFKEGEEGYHEDNDYFTRKTLDEVGDCTPKWLMDAVTEDIEARNDIYFISYGPHEPLAICQGAPDSFDITLAYYDDVDEDDREITGSIVGHASTREEAYDVLSKNLDKPMPDTIDTSSIRDISTSPWQMKYGAIVNCIRTAFPREPGEAREVYILAAKDKDSGMYYTAGGDGRLPDMVAMGEDGLESCKQCLNLWDKEPTRIGEIQKGHTKYIVDFVEAEGIGKYGPVINNRYLETPMDKIAEKMNSDIVKCVSEYEAQHPETIPTKKVKNSEEKYITYDVYGDYNVYDAENAYRSINFNTESAIGKASNAEEALEAIQNWEAKQEGWRQKNYSSIASFVQENFPEEEKKTEYILVPVDEKGKFYGDTYAQKGDIAFPHTPMLDKNDIEMCNQELGGKDVIQIGSHNIGSTEYVIGMEKAHPEDFRYEKIETPSLLRTLQPELAEAIINDVQQHAEELGISHVDDGTRHIVEGRNGALFTTEEKPPQWTYDNGLALGEAKSREEAWEVLKGHGYGQDTEKYKEACGFLDEYMPLSSGEEPHIYSLIAVSRGWGSTEYCVTNSVGGGPGKQGYFDEKTDKYYINTHQKGLPQKDGKELPKQIPKIPMLDEGCIDICRKTLNIWGGTPEQVNSYRASFDVEQVPGEYTVDAIDLKNSSNIAWDEFKKNGYSFMDAERIIRQEDAYKVNGTWYGFDDTLTNIGESYACDMDIKDLEAQEKAASMGQDTYGTSDWPDYDDEEH